MGNYEKVAHCVYVHTNKINGKKYVGQTRKIPSRRWQNGTGYRTQSHFWRAICKYGWESFEHEIFATNLTQDEANKIEKELIKIFDTMNPNKGYNKDSGGNGKRIVSDDTRQLHRELMLGERNHMYGKHMTEEAKKKRYDNYHYTANICQVDISTGEILNRYNTCRDAQRATGLDGSCISKCCRGKRKTCGGFKWKYAND